MKLVMMGHEDIVGEEDLAIRVRWWSWGILSLNDATRGGAPVIARGTLGR